ncbi:MAG: PQQ-binding-like beta-propeller repeat protein [Candidatus Binataceae bacterium]
MTMRPTAANTSVESGDTIGFDAQAHVSRGHKQGYEDITNTVLWSSTAPSILIPPLPDQPGVYTGGFTGCACVGASAASVISNSVTVGVNLDPNSCPTCQPPSPTPTAALVGAATPPESGGAPATGIRNAGVLMWTYDAGAPLRGPISVASDGSIYFITRDGFLHGIDSAGRSILDAPAAGREAAAMAGGTVAAFIQPATLAAFGPGGTVKWRLGIGNGPGPIVVSGGAIYTIAGDEIVSVNSFGLLNWKIPADGAAALTPSSDGVLVGVPGGAVSEIAADGAVAWTVTPPGGFAGTLAAAGDLAYAASASGVLYAIDVRTGRQLWSIATNAKIAAGPAASPSGAIFLGAGVIEAVSPGGGIEWTQPALKPGPGPLAAAGADGVFAAGTSGIGAMIGGGGEFLWTSRSFGAIAQAVASAGGVLYVANSHGKIFAVK